MTAFYRLTHEEWMRARRELKPAEKDVLYYLRTLDPFGDRELDLAVTEIAADCGMDKGTVSRALKSLREKGWIDLEITRIKIRLLSRGIEPSCLQTTELSTDNRVVYRSNELSTDQMSCLQTTEMIATQPQLSTDNDRSPETLQDEAFRSSQTLKTLKTNSDLSIHAHEVESLIDLEAEPEAEPLPLEPERASIPVEVIPVQPKAIGDDTFSAAAPESEIFENWQAFYHKHNRPPWRLESGDFHPLLVRAYHATGGSPGGVNIHDLPQGGMNEPKIKKILRRLDNAALHANYSLKCAAACELQDYWLLAAQLDRSPAFIPTRGNLRAAQNSMAIYNAIKDL